MSFVTPLDWLSNSSPEQDVIRCLVRQPKLTLGEIARITQIPQDVLTPILQQMLGNAQLHAEGEPNKYEIQYGRSAPANGKGANSLLSTLFD